MTNLFYQRLQKQYADGLPFAVFQFEGEALKAFLQVDDRLVEDPSLESTGFAFATFAKTLEGAFYVLQADEVIEADTDVNCEGEVNFSMTDLGDRNNHVSLVQKAICAIENTALQKVVVARRIEAVVSANPLVVFDRLRKKYPNAYSYCFYHPKIGLWMGASPEILLKTTGDQFTTVSLAGTRKNTPENTIEWGEKELEEQQLVTRYIEAGLSQLELPYKVGLVQTIQAGSLLHLKQEFTGLKKGKNIRELLGVLHPTPAVCGMPLQLAVDFIRANEDFTRSFYAGFFGPINCVDSNQTKTSHLAVNIRCMQFLEEKTYIYVGGGITCDSNPELEWEETVNKSLIMASVFE